MLSLKDNISKYGNRAMQSEKKTLVVILCSIPIIIATVLYGEYLTALEQEKIIEQKESNIFPLVSKFETNLLDTVSLLEITAKEKSVINIPFSDQIDPKIHGIKEDQDVEKREIAKAVLSNEENLDAVYFVIPNGDMYLVEPYQYQVDLASSNFAFRDWYKGVIGTKSTYVSELFFAQGKKGDTVAIVTPVKSESGDFVGMWGGLVNLDSWSKQFGEINLAKNENAIIVDHNGNVLIDSKHKSINTIESYLHLQGVNRALAGNSGNIVETINGQNSFVVYAPITVGPHTWAIIITEPYEDAFSSVKLIRLQYVGIVIAMGGVTATAVCLLRGPKTGKAWFFVQKIRQLEEDIIETKPQVTGKLNKKTYSAIIALLMILILVVSSTQDHQTGNTPTSIKDSFLIQNLRGDTVDTWVNWKISKDELFHIHVLDSPEVTTHRMQIISDVIYSKESIKIDDSLLHKGPQGSTSTYYKGWLGALQSVSGETKFAIPIHLHSAVTDKGEGSIIIRLSELQNADGYSAYTKSFVDEENHQILKSVITVYNVDKMNDDQFATIIRHEIGHGFGLAHSTAPEDLMAPEITTPYPYISGCDIDALVDLYNGKQNSQVVCEK